MKGLFALLSLALLLTGCSGMRLVESQVRASAALPEGSSVEAGAKYRFELLPSQVNQFQTDEQMLLVEAELSEVGMVRDDAAARYSVQFSTSMQAFQADTWDSPYNGGRVGGSIMIGSGGMSGIGLGMRFPPPSQYRHELSLLLRDLPSNKVVYETRATHEGPWNDSVNIMRALLAAALKDFPNPPAGTRRVKVEIAR